MANKAKNNLRNKFIAASIVIAESFASIVHASAPLHEKAHEQTHTFNTHASQEKNTRVLGHQTPDMPEKEGEHEGGNQHVPERERREREGRRGVGYFEIPPRRSGYNVYQTTLVMN